MIPRPLRSKGWLALCSLVVAACSGGSCGGGCGGCAVEPIPGGFPLEDRIANAAQMRVTDEGLAFLETNAGPLIERLSPEPLVFPVPRSTIEQGCAWGVCTVRTTVCPGENCWIAAQVTGMDLQPVAPNRIQLRLRLTLDSRYGDPDTRGAIPVRGRPDCDVDVDTGRGGRPHVTIGANLDFVEESVPPRTGYTRLVVRDVALVENLEDDDIDLDCGWLSFLVDFFKDRIVGGLTDQVRDTLQSSIDEQLCTRHGTSGCPTNSHTRDDSTDPEAICYFDSVPDRCVPTLLGTDGQGDLGEAALGGISPGTHAPSQFLLAAGGEGEAVNDGLSLFFYGGFRSTDISFATSPAHNPCVPVVDPPPLPTIPRVTTFRGNAIPGGGSAHIGFGIAEGYLDHVGYGLFDSGMLCLGAGVRTSQQLSTGLFSVLVPSIAALTFPEPAAPISLALRPQKPLDFAIGQTAADEPLLTALLPEMETDFYVWSHERYVRFMTFKADWRVAIDLRVEDGRIVPSIQEVTVENGEVTNSELLQEPPPRIASALETIIGAAAEMLGGGLSGFDLPEVMGLQLTVPDGGILGFEEEGERFLGIFANLALPAAPISEAPQTRLRVGEVRIDPKALRIETWGEGEWPSVELWLDGESPSGAALEFSVRVDGAAWSPWRAERRVVLRHKALRLQGRHRIEARARVAGSTVAFDRSPAVAEVLVDVLPPAVRLWREGATLRLSAADVVSARDALRFRLRMADGAWTDWQPLPDGEDLGVTVLGQDPVEVEVRDEAGNVGSAQLAIVRGVPNPARTGGCGSCTLAASPAEGASGWLLGLVLLGWLGIRRRCLPAPQRRSLSSSGWRRVLLTGALFGTLSVGACDCGDGTTPGTIDGGEGCGDCASGQLCCEAMGVCVDVTAVCDAPFVCADGALSVDESCTPRCSECVPPPPLDPGQLASHLDADVDGAGTLWIAGYAPGAPTRPPVRYGDLVVGTWNASSRETDWQIVDGVPDDAPVTHAPDGWRAGISEPGDDVGRHASIAVAEDDTVYVAYWDATNRALKLAWRDPDSGAWTVHTVDEEGDAGRYASIALRGAVPFVAYLVLSPPPAGESRPVSVLRVARASAARPSGPSDWTMTDVLTLPMPCRAALCPAGTVCTESGDCAAPSGSCPATCADEEACIDGSCQPVLGEGFLDDVPPARATYLDLEPTSGGLALAYYDRAEGNLHVVEEATGTWGEPLLVDGWARGVRSVGDSGLSVDLFVADDGSWHLAYVDGAEEVLRYAVVQGGSVVSRETVDDGSTLDGTSRFTDGRHLVGDDASLLVLPSGEVRIAYQDATAHQLRLARKPRGENGWTRSVLDAEDHSGFWVVQVPTGASSSAVVTWWRNETSMPPSNGVRVFTVD